MTSRQQYADWFTANAYPMARSFASKYPIGGIEQEDYVQELLLKAWEKMEDYVPSKSSVSTFVYQWFTSVRVRIIDKQMHMRRLFDSVDVEDADGNVCNVCETAPSDDDVSGLCSSSEEMAMLTDVSVAFLRGDPIRSIAKAFGMTRDEVMASVASDIELLRSIREEDA